AGKAEAGHPRRGPGGLEARHRGGPARTSRDKGARTGRRLNDTKRTSEGGRTGARPPCPRQRASALRADVLRCPCRLAVRTLRRHDLAPSHLPTPTQIESWPVFTPEMPLRVLVSGCLAGRLCGVDGTSYGEHPLARRLLELPNVQAVAFCPEEEAFGTPRAMPDIHAGDGFDVLDGRRA